MRAVERDHVIVKQQGQHATDARRVAVDQSIHDFSADFGRVEGRVLAEIVHDLVLQSARQQGLGRGVHGLEQVALVRMVRAQNV